MTFVATWGCASDFLKMLPKFIMVTKGQLKFFLWAQKLKKLVLSIFVEILTSHSSQLGEVQVIF